MVDLEYCLAHCEVLHTLLEFLVELGTAAVEVLIVNPHRQYKMQEFPHRHLLSPWHFGTCPQCIINVLQVILGIVVGNVGQRHIGIEELHGLQSVTRQGLKNVEIAFVGNQLTTCLEILGYPTTLIKIFTSRHRHEREHRCNK